MAVYRMEYTKSGKPSSGNLPFSYPEAAAQSFKRGDPVKLNTSGQVLIAVDTEGSLGIAKEDASGTTNNVVQVILHDFKDLYSASGSAAGATRTVTQSDVGLRCSYIKSTVTGETDKTVIDVSDTQSDVLVIVGVKDAVGTVDGRYYFQWLSTQYIPRGT